MGLGKVFRTIKYSVVNAVATIVEGEKDGEIIDYGKKNSLPNEIILTVDDSGTATNCLDKITSFIQADGFKDKATSSKIITRYGKTADQFLADISSNVAYFTGFVGLIQFGIEGEVKTIDRVPFETVRKVVGGGFKVNKNFGKKEYKKLESVSYREFDPKEDPAKRMVRIMATENGPSNYPGEIIYVFEKRTGKDIYPVPRYYSSIEDLLSDAGLVKLENRNINDGFRPAVIIKTARLNDTVVDGKKSEAENFDQTLEEFMGADAAPAFVIETDNGDVSTDVTVFPLGEMLDGVDKARDRVPRAICRSMGVPPSIIGMTVPEGLGNQQALANSMKLFNLSILKYQNMISSAMKMVFPENDWTITTLNIIQYIDPTIISKLTNDEIRGLIGYPSLEKEIPSEAQKTAQALGTLSPLVATKVLDNMTSDEIRALVALGPKVIVQSPTPTP